jgi:hypothetical protein
VEVIHKVPEIAALSAEAFSGQPMTIELIPRSAGPNWPHYTAHCIHETATIRILGDGGLDDYDKVSSWIYEMCNAANEPLSIILCQNYLNEDHFAVGKEREEYESCLRFASVISCLARHAEVLDMLADSCEQTRDVILARIDNEARYFSFPSFGAYWRDVEANGHAGLYREYYRDYVMQTLFQQALPILLPFY